MQIINNLQESKKKGLKPDQVMHKLKYGGLSQRKKQCNLCSFEATTRARLTAHRHAEHGWQFRKHRCTRCCVNFASTKSFVRHVRRHASTAAFPCPTIGSGLPMNYNSKILSQSIYVFATISLANHYHNISSKAFILRDRYNLQEII